MFIYVHEVPYGVSGYRTKSDMAILSRGKPVLLVVVLGFLVVVCTIGLLL